jgi:hypothetical protein
MSQRHAQNIRKIEEGIMVMAIALLAPLIVSFILYLVSSAAAGPGGIPASVGYGITSTSSPSSGVSCLWTPASGPCPSIPTILLTLINSVMIFVSIIVALVTGIRLAPSLLEFGGDQ